jgi:hypothetical protein
MQEGIVRKPLPWPVLFVMYRAACAPRIFMRPDSRLLVEVKADSSLNIEVKGECELHAAYADGPTIVVREKS